VEQRGLQPHGEGCDADVVEHLNDLGDWRAEQWSSGDSSRTVKDVMQTLWHQRPQGSKEHAEHAPGSNGNGWHKDSRNGRQDCNPPARKHERYGQNRGPGSGQQHAMNGLGNGADWSPTTTPPFVPVGWSATRRSDDLPMPQGHGQMPRRQLPEQGHHVPAGPAAAHAADPHGLLLKSWCNGDLHEQYSAMLDRGYRGVPGDGMLDRRGPCYAQSRGGGEWWDSSMLPTWQEERRFLGAYEGQTYEPARAKQAWTALPPRSYPAHAQAVRPSESLAPPGGNARPEDSPERGAGGTRALHQDHVSPHSFAAMKRVVARVGKPMQFLKVIHVGCDKKEFEEAVESEKYPIVRGVPAAEGAYIGFMKDESFLEMRQQLSALNKRAVLQQTSGIKKRPHNTESRIRYKYEPFVLSAGDEEVPVLHRLERPTHPPSQPGRA